MADRDEESCDEAMEIDLQELKSTITKLQASHKQKQSKRRLKIAQLRRSVEEHKRDMQQKSKQYKDDKAAWMQQLAARDTEITIWQHDLAKLRQDMKQLILDFRAQVKLAEGMSHLICDICLERPKCRITRCGHGFCADCLSGAFKAQEARRDGDEVLVVGEVTCPTCRQSLDRNQGIWPVYLLEGQA